MREILFRGKRIDNGEWVEGYLNYNSTRKQYYIMDDVDTFPIPVHKESVGQFTGLTDKNGKKIFEGDVVDILTENEEVGFVTYDEGCFFVKADGFSVDFRNNINGNDLLIIGNIHDNPELLKGGEE